MVQKDEALALLGQCFNVVLEALGRFLEGNAARRKGKAWHVVTHEGVKLPRVFGFEHREGGGLLHMKPFDVGHCIEHREERFAHKWMPSRHNQNSHDGLPQYGHRMAVLAESVSLTL